MEARIREEFPDAEVELVESAGGVYEVTVDGELIHSKKATGRHAEWEQVKDQMERRQSEA